MNNYSQSAEQRISKSKENCKTNQSFEIRLFDVWAAGLFQNNEFTLQSHFSSNTDSQYGVQNILLLIPRVTMTYPRNRDDEAVLLHLSRRRTVRSLWHMETIEGCFGLHIDCQCPCFPLCNSRTIYTFQKKGFAPLALYSLYLKLAVSVTLPIVKKNVWNNTKKLVRGCENKYIYFWIHSKIILEIPKVHILPINLQIARNNIYVH